MMKKRTILLFGVAVLAVVGAIVFCLSMTNRIERQMDDSATVNLLSTTQVIADTMEGLIEKDYDSLNVVGSTCMDGVFPTSEELLAFRETMNMDWLGVVDKHGNGIDCFGNQYKAADFPDLLTWNLQESGHTDAYTGQLSGRLQITLWTPIYSNGDYIGAVLGNVILTQYYSANVFTFYSGQGRTFIFDSTDGKWILKSLGTDGTVAPQKDIYSLLEASGNSAEDIIAFRNMVEDGKSGVAVLNFNGERSYLCFLPQAGAPSWYVTTVIPRDVLLQESAEVQRMIRWVLVILCVVLTAFAIILSTWMVRKTKMKETQYRQALFANLSANLDSAFLIYEKAKGQTVFVSDNSKRLFGLNRKWLSEDARRLFDWCNISPDDPQRIAFLEGTLDNPAVREVCVKNELGESSRIIRLELIPADLGQELAVLTDITSDKEIQRSLIEAMERAEAASHAKNDFLSAMSHDLRTPINGIVGMTTIAAANLEDKSRLRDSLTKISESTAQLLRLINEVLDMAQIESGKLVLSQDSFNIAELLQDVLSISYPGIQQKNHTVKVNIHLMEHEKVIGDPVRMTKIATNLLSNAIKYTPSGGLITMELREKEPVLQGYGCYELVMRDNGIGMSEQFQKRLFEPFEREEDVRLSRIQGTGLGLAIVKKIVEQMMGSIHVKSEKNKGTTFCVTINLQLDEEEKENANQLAGLPVLVVDDDVDTCETVSEILCDIGMEGEWTDNGSRAVEMVAQRHERDADYLAVLLDWKMPGMDGVETARQIRAKVGSNVPIIILTAYGWDEIETQARQAGVDLFMSKPVYRSKLLRKMTEITDGNLELSDMGGFLPATDIPPGRRVLLAEDNELNMEIAVELLRMMGVTADWARNGDEAVKQFAASEPGTYNLILMDIQMPKMNGYEATRMIRSMDRPDSRTVPIVAMTADAFKKDEQLVHEAGMDEHLTKPVSIERLAQTLKRFFTRKTETGEETYHDKT